MRLLHNIEQPPPGRGGRKRKRDEDASAMQDSDQASFSGPAGLSGFSTFKVEPQTPSELPDDNAPHIQLPRDDAFDANGRPRRSPSPADRLPFSYPLLPFLPSGFANGNSEEDASADTLPDYLAQQLDPQTGLIRGRTPAMVMYLLMKARHRYASEQHELLLEELKITRQELQRVRDEKERALDDVFRGYFGFVTISVYVVLVQPNSQSSSGAVYCVIHRT